MADAIGSTKRCGRCKGMKSPADFGPDKKTPDGLSCWCRTCSAAYMAARRASKPKLPRKPRQRKPVPERDAKPCGHCGITKPLVEFSNDKARRDGLKCWCRACTKIEAAKFWIRIVSDPGKKTKRYSAQREWNHANTDKRNQYVYNYREKEPDRCKLHQHNRRARLSGAEGSYTPDDIARILSDQKGKCAYCRKSIRKTYHVDHISPLAKGGSNRPSNLQLTCKSCNSRKHATDPIDFARQIGRLL